MGKRIRIDPSFFFFTAVLLLLLPLPWLLAVFLATMAHECAHCFAVTLLGGTILEAEVSLRGAKLHAAPMAPGRELVCILAGPAASFALLGLYRLFPRIAVCGLIQGVFNLLPIYPLDGGRAIRCAVTLLKQGEPRFFKAIGKIPCKEGKQRVQ